MNTQEAKDTIVKLEDLITLKAASALLECRPGRLSKMAKKGEVPGAIQVLGRWGFNPLDLEGFTVPKSASRVGKPKRADGRTSHRIYLTPDEALALRESGFEVISGAEERAKRKAAKAAKAAAAGDAVVAGAVPTLPANPTPMPHVEDLSSEEDPFAAFGTG